jgi:NAD+ synthetase
MKIRLEQLNPIIGDVEGNTKLIKRALARAEKDDIDLLVLPELVVCGYSPMDMLERPDFVEDINQANAKIIRETNSTAILFGTVTSNDSGIGRKQFNSALLAYNGEVQAEIHKTLLPTYDVYDELRYFEPATSLECVIFKDRKIGVTICEDIWYNYSEVQYHTYRVNPAEELVKKGAEAIFNLSASPYSKGKPEGRTKVLFTHAEKLQVPIFYANQVGGNTELVSDGDSMAVSQNSEIVVRAPLFKEAYVDVFWEGQEIKSLSSEKVRMPSQIEQIFQAIQLGLKDYLRKTGVTEKVVIGLSGGIDSALVAAIAVAALGPERVVGITMPSEFSSKGSITDSKKLADNLGIELHELAIKDIYNKTLATLSPLFKGTDFDVTEENIQPRIRGMLLMAYSNKFGHMLLNTGNKSELATGYCTLYGDMAGGLSIISDLYKSEVYEMSHWLNEHYFNKVVIPEETLLKPPSAELRPEQKDSDALPDYEILDGILEAYIENKCSIQEIVDMGYDLNTVKKITKIVDRQEFKRNQAPPGLKVSQKAFGNGRRWPIVQQWDNKK